MRALLAAGLALAALALPVSAAKPGDPYLTLDTPGPYHYAETIVVTIHDAPHFTAHIQMRCFQNGATVWTEVIEPVEDGSYDLHLGPGDIRFGISTWDINGGGAADCTIRFTKSSHVARIPYTVIDFHVEA